MKKELSDGFNFANILKSKGPLILSGLFFLISVILLSINYFGLNDYRVEFIGPDGEIVGTGIFEKGELIIYPQPPEKEGYTFKNWKESSSSFARLLTFISEYEINQYQIEFQDYDGRFIETQTVSHGEDAVFIGTPTRIGHTFKNWSDEITNVRSNLVVMAEYEIDYYEIVFYDSENQPLSTQVVKYGESVTEPTAPTKVDHIFTGWNQSYEMPERSMNIYPVFREIPRISTLQQIDELNVLFGTPISEILELLPKNLIIIDTWDEEWEVDLNWVLYELNTMNPAIAPARFIVSGLFSVPEGLSRGSARTQVDTFINVGPGLVSVVTPSSISLPIGSTIEDLATLLPSSTRIVDSLGDSPSVDVIWEMPSNFDELMRQSSFEVKGIIRLPEGTGASASNPAKTTILVTVGQ